MSLAVRLGAALLVIVVGGGCGISRTSARPAAPTPGPVRYLLPNGMPVIIQEHRTSDVVAVQLWVRVGSRDETAAEHGLAHCLETRVARQYLTRATVVVVQPPRVEGR